jgi:hypothetical protein
MRYLASIFDKKPLVVYLLIAWLLNSCDLNKTKSTKVDPKLLSLFTTPSLLKKSDSLIMVKAKATIFRSTKVSSNYDCTDIYTMFDIHGDTVLVRKVDNCNSNTSTIWTKETYYGSNKNVVLQISLDGLSQILEVNR